MFKINIFFSVEKDAFTPAEAVELIYSATDYSVTEAQIETFFTDQGIFGRQFDANQNDTGLVSCPVQNKNLVCIQSCDCVVEYLITHKGILYLMKNADVVLKGKLKREIDTSFYYKKENGCTIEELNDILNMAYPEVQLNVSEDMLEGLDFFTRIAHDSETEYSGMNTEWVRLDNGNLIITEKGMHVIDAFYVKKRQEYYNYREVEIHL